MHSADFEASWEYLFGQKSSENWGSVGDQKFGAQSSGGLIFDF